MVKLTDEQPYERKEQVGLDKASLSLGEITENIWCSRAKLQDHYALMEERTYSLNFLAQS